MDEKRSWKIEGFGHIYKKGHAIKRPDGNITWYESPSLWISFKHHGKWSAESAGTIDFDAAVLKLKERVNELQAGRKTVKEHKLRFEDLIKQIELDYSINKKRSVSSLQFYLKHLREFFCGYKAVEIRQKDILEYIQKRQQERAKNSTINRELAALRRAFNLAKNSGDLVYQPRIPNLEENNARQGFVSPADFVRLHDNLPGYLRNFVEFLYLTGIRSGAARGLEHRHVDIENKVIHLPIELCKNKHGQTIPLSGRLLNLIEAQWSNRSLDCQFLFHYENKQFGNFRKAFDAACKKAGLHGIVPHDLRRSAVRNFVRAGIPERIAMALSGHMTRSVFDRYNIVSEQDLLDASSKLQRFLSDHNNDSKIKQIQK